MKLKALMDERTNFKHTYLKTSTGIPKINTNYKIKTKQKMRSFLIKKVNFIINYTIYHTLQDDPTFFKNSRHHPGT